MSTFNVNQKYSAVSPRVSDNFGRLNSVTFTFDTSSFTKYWSDPKGGSPKTVTVHGVPSVDDLYYTDNNPISVGAKFEVADSGLIQFKLGPKYSIHNGVLYEFTKSIDDIIADYKAVGLELISNVNGRLIFIDPKNLVDIRFIQGKAIDNRHLRITFTVSSSVSGADSNKAYFDLIPWENVNIKQNYILKGFDGAAVRLLGTDPAGGLPTTGNSTGDAYFITNSTTGALELHIWDGTAWVNIGSIQGPVGPAGPQGPEGPAGPTGPAGPQGPAGLDAEFAHVEKAFTYVAGNPQVFAVADSSLVTDVYGKGKRLERNNPDGTPDEWDIISTTEVRILIPLMNGDRITIISSTTKVTGLVGPEGPQGPQGPQGVQGNNVKLLGQLSSTAELPTTGNVAGDAYNIPNAQGLLEMWSWDGAAWVNAGLFQGPIGPQGEKGTLQIAQKEAVDLPETYPQGVSYFGLSTATGWPATKGTVETVKNDHHETFQIFVETGTANMWRRAAGLTNWGEWVKLGSEDIGDSLTSRNVTIATATHTMPLDVIEIVATIDANTAITFSGGVDNQVYRVKVILGVGAPYNFEFTNLRNTNNAFSTTAGNVVYLFIRKSRVSYILDNITTLYAPVITLKGNQKMAVQLGGTYTELGADVTDEEQGDLSANLVITGTVDTTVAGWYNKYYNAKDSDDIAAIQKIREVKVNRAPVLDAAFPDILLSEGWGTHTIDTTTKFSDPDGDTLVHSGSTSSDTAKVTVYGSGRNIVLYEKATKGGTVTITAHADDTWGGTVSDPFVVTLNQNPIVKTTIADQSQVVGFTSYTIELATVGAEVFTDPDGDAMTYSATSSATTIVTVSVTGSTLTVTAADGVTTGTSNITVTANDGRGGTKSDVFVHTTTA